MEKSQNRKPFQALRDLFHPVDLTHGTCWRTILQFSLPVILSYLLQQVYTISDAAIVGQTLTAQEVAGVNDTASLVFIFLQFAFGVSAGFCVITSCCVGCRDQAGVRRSMAAQLVLSPPGFRAASNETGRRPTTGRGPRRQPPANTNGGEGPRAGAGQGRAAAIWPHTFYVCPSGANSAAGARAPNRDGGAAGLAPGGLAARAAGGTDRSRGHPSRSWGGVAAKKMPGSLPPRLDSDWTKKNAGRTLCPPRLPLQRIPDFPLFGVVVRNVLDAGQFHMLL